MTRAQAIRSARSVASRTSTSLPAGAAQDSSSEESELSVNSIDIASAAELSFGAIDHHVVDNRLSSMDLSGIPPDAMSSMGLNLQTSSRLSAESLLKAQALSPPLPLPPHVPQEGSGDPETMKSLLSTIVCSICLDVLVSPTTLNCSNAGGHTFCKSCINSHQQSAFGRACPQCAAPITAAATNCQANDLYYTIIHTAPSTLLSDMGIDINDYDRRYAEAIVEKRRLNKESEGIGRWNFWKFLMENKTAVAVGAAIPAVLTGLGAAVHLAYKASRNSDGRRSGRGR